MHANKGPSVLALNEAQTEGTYVNYVKEVVLSKHVKHISRPVVASFKTSCSYF